MRRFIFTIIAIAVVLAVFAETAGRSERDRRAEELSRKAD